MKTKNEIEVLIDEDFENHMAAHPEVTLDVVAEAVGMVDYIRPEDVMGFSKEMFSVDLGHTVGLDSLVETTAEDTIEYRQRPNRDGLTRYVIGRQKEETSIVNFLLATVGGKSYICTCFFGNPGTPEPWDAHLSDEGRAEAEEFWSSHALVAED